jgi:hypothetical protein
MTIERVFQNFLNQFRINANKPASEARLTEADLEFGFALPASLRACYRICDGGEAENDRSRLRLFSLKELSAYDTFRGFLLSFWGLFPFLDNNESNPVCVCCKSPLTG